MQPLMKTLTIATMLALIFSSFTLWLIESWLKYPLFLFEILAIIVLYLIVGGYDIKITTKLTRVGNLNTGLSVDLFQIVSAFGLLMFNILHVDGGLVQLALALLCTSLFSGYALLNISGLERYFSRLETGVLSFILSYAYTGFITLATLNLNENMRIPIILSSFIGLGLVSAIKHKRNPITFSSKSFTKNIDLLALLLSEAFYVLSFYFIYPGFAYLPGSDISRHYANSITLGRTPNLIGSPVYILSYLHESTILSLSNPSLASAQTALVTLNLFLPLAFYVMAKPYLERVDVRLPSLATTFWVLFTNSFGGIAWLYFLTLKLSSAGQSQLQLLSSTADKTYNGTIYGIFSLWYVPATVSFIILMTTIFLISKRQIEKSKYFMIFSVLIAASYLTHVTEMVVFILFLAIFGTISKNENYRIDDALKSSIISMIIVIATYYALSQISLRFIINTSLLFSLIAPTIALVFGLVFRRYIRPKLSSLQKPLKVNKRVIGRILVIALFFVYCVALLSWTTVLDSFHTWQVDTLGLVPWFMYPVMLGINGLLAILALYYLVKDSKLYGAFTLFIAFMVFAFITGRIVSTVNLYLFDAGYWEKRFIWFIKIPLAILAPIPIIYFLDRLRNSSLNVKTMASVTIIGVVTLYGISTTFLNLEYWNMVANNTSNIPSQNEMGAINALRKIFDNDPKAWLATVTSTSSSIATFAAPADQLVLKQLLYTAYRPEMVFTQLYRHPAYDHAYIYLHNRDVTQLSKYTDRFFDNYIKTLPLVYENSEVKIYNVSKVSPPLPNSDTVLVIPLDKTFVNEQTLYTVYSLLSNGLYNYTVALDLDDKALNSKTITLSYDPPVGGILTGSFEQRFNGTLSSYTIVKGNWQLTSGELLGGETGKYGEGIILSPATAENLTASFKVKPLSGNATVPNYVSLVYSWIDSKNYRIADVMFSTDGYIYVHFRTIVDGFERAIPNWPGIKTDIKWNFSDEYTISIIVNGTLNKISINGKPYLSIELENIPGRIGLRYYRFYQVSFDDFSVTYSVPLNLRPTEDYLNYLKSGGKLIVLNTNGFNYFADSLFLVENSTFSVGKIEGLKATLNLPEEIILPKLILKNSSTRVLSQYIGLDGEAPFVLKQSYGEGELFYVNIYPIIKAMNENTNPSIYYDLLGKLLNDLNLPKMDSNFVLSVDGYVKEIRLRNGINVETTSLIFPSKTTLKQLEIQTVDGKRQFFNVTNIEIKNYSKLLINAENLKISEGQGFYATLIFNNSFTIKPREGSFDLEIVTEGAKYYITQAKQFSITPYTSIQLLARTPKVNASEVTFIEFYTFGTLNWRTRANGQNLNVNGTTSFQIIVSDSYAMVKNVELGKSFERDPPLVMFNDLSTIPTAIFWGLLLLPLFIGAILIFISKELTQNNREK